MVAVLQLRFQLFYFRKLLNLHKITRRAAILLLSARDFCITSSDSIVHVIPSNLLWLAKVTECPYYSRELVRVSGSMSFSG